MGMVLARGYKTSIHFWNRWWERYPGKSAKSEISQAKKHQGRNGIVYFLSPCGAKFVVDEESKTLITVY
jgi:hypothetical protein